MTASSPRTTYPTDATSAILTNRRAENKETADDARARVIVARARAIRNGFREERRLTRACRGLGFRDGTRCPSLLAIARRRTADHRRVTTPRTIRIRLITFRVARARHLSLAEGVQGRAHTSHMIRNTRARY